MFFNPVLFFISCNLIFLTFYVKNYFVTFFVVLAAGFLAGVFFSTSFFAGAFVTSFLTSTFFLASTVFSTTKFSSLAFVFLSLSKDVKWSACLYFNNAFIVAIELFNLLFEPIIFDNIFSYHANSRVALTEEPAFNHVPLAAGMIFTVHALYLFIIAYGTVLPLVIGTLNIFLYASFAAFFTAEVTSTHLDKPSQIFHFLSQTKTVALKDILLHQVVTLVTFLTSKSSSSNSFFVLSFPSTIKYYYISKYFKFL